MPGVVSGQESMYPSSHLEDRLFLIIKMAFNRILEHLDSLAGSIAYKHMLGPVRSVGNLEERGFYIVTASVDRFVQV